MRMQRIYLRNLPSVDKVGGPADGMTCIVTGPTRLVPTALPSRAPPKLLLAVQQPGAPGPHTDACVCATRLQRHRA